MLTYNMNMTVLDKFSGVFSHLNCFIPGHKDDLGRSFCYLCCKAKVPNLDIHLTGEHDVGEGEVSVHDPVGVQVQQPGHNLNRHRYSMYCTASQATGLYCRYRRYRP